jgi:mono/diheme cytochrome c family protein
MAFQNLSDEDLIAIISYLRAQPPVKNQVPKSEPSFLGKAIMAFGALKPEQPEKTPPKMIARTVSAEYGEYMAIAVADCYGCHTKRDLQTGAFIGEAFAGGMLFEPDAFTQGYAFISPNLTPDKETGWISSWTEEAFLARITGGRVHKTSPMPWGFYARLDSIETRAIYTYLQTLKPVSQKIEKVIYEPGEEYPKE